MLKHTRLLAPAVLAAATMLLTACDLGGSTEATQQNPSVTTASSAGGKPTPAGSTPDSGSSDPTEPQPVDCGEVTVDGGVVHRLIADVGVSGLVTCTAATKVLNEFVAVPVADRNKSGSTELEGGWLCTALTEDNGEMTYHCVMVFEGGTDGDHGEDLVFYTKPV